MKGRTTICFALTGMLLALLVAGDLMTGSAGVTPGVQVLLHLRAPRVATALLAGAALGLAGLLMQTIFRNPLADPHIMGVSSGSSLCVAAVLMAGGAGLSGATGLAVHGHITVALAAVAGAVLCSALVVAVSLRTRRASTLLLFGVMLGYVVSAITQVLSYGSSSQSLKMFWSWSAGSFTSADFGGDCVMAALLLAGLIMALAIRRGLDAALFGDDFALMAHTAPRRTRILAILAASLLTGGVTAFCGPLGFVGIVSPHIARRISAISRHSVTIPLTLMVGASITLLSDALSQLPAAVLQFAGPLPVGSVMALIGIPVIIYILLHQREV